MESRAPDGSPVAQQVLGFDYLALERGPLSYATGLIDGYKTQESLRLPDTGLPDTGLPDTGLPDTGVEQYLSELPGDGPGAPPRLLLRPLQREALEFLPAFLADGRRAGGWRLTWMSLAPGVEADD
jgi:hypothetical protein